MNVSRILSIKGRRIETIRPEASLADAIDLLSAKGIGAVVVTDTNGTVCGILSERDIVRALARHRDALSSRCAQHMTAHVVTCTPDMMIGEVMEEMTRGRFRHMPVIEHGKLIGIVSIGDVVKHRLEDIEAESRAMRDYIATA